MYQFLYQYISKNPIAVTGNFKTRKKNLEALVFKSLFKNKKNTQKALKTIILKVKLFLNLNF